MFRTTIRLIAIAAALSAAVLGCTMKKQEAPAVTGPSEFGTSISVQITPDTITQDGASQALVTITARDASGVPLRNVTLRVETFQNGTRVDVGTLSARTVVTGSDGKATLTYTAPPGVANGSEAQVEIAVTPLGGDFNNAVTRSASVRLVPQGIVLPPVGLVASFTVSPGSPIEDIAATFDASASQGNPVSYAWSFSDGTSATGKVVSKAFAEPGNYFTTLTITDEFGRSVSTTRALTVDRANPPTAAFTFSPTDPRINQPVNFNASGSSAAQGRRIVAYRWDFGDGIQQETASPITNHSYSLPRIYRVSLTVVDDTGRTATQSIDVTVAAAAPVPVP